MSQTSSEEFSKSSSSSESEDNDLLVDVEREDMRRLNQVLNEYEESKDEISPQLRTKDE